MSQYKNPGWWSPDNDFAWEHVKMAMKRDWEQTKHGRRPDAEQQMDYAARQASGMKPVPPLGQLTFEELEPAYRFGYGARLKFGMEYPEWDNDLEIRLAREWRTMDPTRKEKWERDRIAIRYGWNYEAEELVEHDEA